MSISGSPILAASAVGVVTATEDLYQPERICSLGYSPSIYYEKARLEVGVEVPDVVRMIEGILRKERRIISYADDYAAWCESMGMHIGRTVNVAHLGAGSEIWTRFEGDTVWCQSVIWQNLDLGRAVLQSLVAEGAVFESSHTEIRTGIFTSRYYVRQEGLDSWTAARLLQLEGEPCS